MLEQEIIRGSFICKADYKKDKQAKIKRLKQ